MIVQMVRTNLQYVEKTLVGRGYSLISARIKIAEKLKIGPGTYERLIRGRVKRVDAEVWKSIQALVVKEIEAEIAQRRHHLETAKKLVAAGAKGLTDEQIATVEACIAEMVEIIERPPD